ncbi:MAG: glycosyltransferase, partial [Verrucomicrobiota bacterium]
MFDFITVSDITALAVGLGFVMLVVCTGLLAHTYAVFPKLLKFLAGDKKLPELEATTSPLPEVAVLMAVYNEESVIRATLESIVAQDYPKDRFRIYLGSDGSTDETHPIIQSFLEEHPYVQLEIYPGRNGKIRIINDLHQKASAKFFDKDNAVLFLCDANVVWEKTLVSRTVSHFQRPEVGLVGANVMDADLSSDGISEQEEAYIGQENRIKFHEGVLWGRVIGAFGACYAMRNRLFEPVPTNYIVDDFYLTMKVIEAKHDTIVDLDARCYETVSSKISEEFRRK